jgi:hypothetical protein
MSKTVLEVGLILGGLAVALAAGPVGLIALQGNLAMMNAMIGIGLTTTLSGVGLALRPNTRTVGAANTLSFSQGPTPRRVIYGQFQTAGVLTYASFPPASNLQQTNQYLHLIYTLTGHEISSFDGVSINGTVRNFGVDLVYQPGGVTDLLWHVDPSSSGSANDLYWQHMFFEFDFGRAVGGGSFPNLAGGDPAWTAACNQQGCAKVHVILRYDSTWNGIFPGGQIPNIQFLVTGKNLIDTRVLSAWLPSTSYLKYNWLLDNHGILWYQTNTSGTSGAAGSRPNFEGASSFPATLSDNTLSWTSYGQGQGSISAGADGNPQGHIVQGRLVNDAWVPGAGYSPNLVIEAPLGYLQQATNSGTTGATEPAFSLTLGGTTTDNSQNWVCLGRSWHAINPSNPALVVNDYLQDTDYGMKAQAATIDTSSVSAAANVCEEQALIIWNADNTVVYENLYSCNGMFDHSSVRGNVLTSLCGSMAGWVIPPGDMWHVFAGAFQTPTVALGDTDMRGSIKGDFRLSKRDLLNTVGADFVPAFLPSNPAGSLSLTQVPATWQKMSAPEYQANGLAGKPNYLNSEDGGQILRIKLQLDFTTSLWTAQRLEKIAMMRSRFPQTLTLPAKLTALQLEAGDTFSFTHTRWGILAQVFEATQATVTLDGSHGGGGKDQSPVVGVDIIARQVDPSIYEFQGPTSASNYGEYSPYGITGVMTGVE